MMIYRGPGIVRRHEFLVLLFGILINYGVFIRTKDELECLLRSDGYENIRAAIGTENAKYRSLS